MCLHWLQGVTISAHVHSCINSSFQIVLAHVSFQDSRAKKGAWASDELKTACAIKKLSVGFVRKEFTIHKWHPKERACDTSIGSVLSPRSSKASGETATYIVMFVFYISQ